MATAKDHDAQLRAATAKFWKLVQRGEPMKDAFSEAAEFVDSVRSRELRWELIESLGDRVGFKPWKRTLK